jgi:DNA-binding transcriptional ArsR family regulator
MENKDISLNDNDEKLLAFCDNRERTVGEISDYLNIRPSSVSLRLQKLEALNLVVVNRGGIGKKTLVRRKESVKKSKGNKTKKFMIEALKTLKEKGEMTPLEFAQIFPFDFSDESNQDKKSALAYLEFSYPPLVERKIKLSSAGEKFLEQNK